MQFTLVALLSLVAAAVASPISHPQRLDDITSRDLTAREPQVNAETAAMSSSTGDVVSFDSAAVFKPAPSDKRQINAEAAAMSSATGDVVTFDSTAVTQPMLAAGDKRQVAEEAAAMSSAGGDVVSFDSTGVTQPMTAAGDR